MPFASDYSQALVDSASAQQQKVRRVGSQEAQALSKAERRRRAEEKLAKASPQRLARAKQRLAQRTRLSINEYASTQESISATPDDLGRSIKKRKRSRSNVTSTSISSQWRPHFPAQLEQLASTAELVSSIRESNARAGSPQARSEEVKDGFATIISNANEETLPCAQVLESTEPEQFVPASIEDVEAKPARELTVRDRLCTVLDDAQLDADQLADYAHAAVPVGEAFIDDSTLSSLRPYIVPCTTDSRIRNCLRTIANKFMRTELLSKEDFVALLQSPNQEDLELFWTEVKFKDDLEDSFENEIQQALQEMYCPNWYNDNSIMQEQSMSTTAELGPDVTPSDNKSPATDQQDLVQKPAVNAEDPSCLENDMHNIDQDSRGEKGILAASPVLQSTQDPKVNTLHGEDEDENEDEDEDDALFMQQAIAADPESLQGSEHSQTSDTEEEFASIPVPENLLDAYSVVVDDVAQGQTDGSSASENYSEPGSAVDPVPTTASGTSITDDDHSLLADTNVVSPISNESQPNQACKKVTTPMRSFDSDLKLRATASQTSTTSSGCTNDAQEGSSLTVPAKQLLVGDDSEDNFLRSPSAESYSATSPDMAEEPIHDLEPPKHVSLSKQMVQPTKDLTLRKPGKRKTPKISASRKKSGDVAIIEYKSGSLSKHEQDLVQDAAEALMADLDLTYDEFCHAVHENTRKDRKSFWVRLIHCIPERKPKNMREYIKKAYRPVEQVALPWTEEEKQFLDDLVAEHGHQWSKIGCIMNRYREDCQQVYRRMEAARTATGLTGPWTAVELAAFESAMTKQDAKINLEEVSQIVGTRSPRQVADHIRFSGGKRSTPQSPLAARSIGRKAPRMSTPRQSATSSMPIIQPPQYREMSHSDLLQFVEYCMKIDLQSLDEFDLPSDLREWEVFGYDQLQSRITGVRKKIRNWRTMQVGETLDQIKTYLEENRPQVAATQEEDGKSC